MNPLTPLRKRESYKFEGAPFKPAFGLSGDFHESAHLAPELIPRARAFLRGPRDLPAKRARAGATSTDQRVPHFSPVLGEVGIFMNPLTSLRGHPSKTSSLNGTEPNISPKHLSQL